MSANVSMRDALYEAPGPKTRRRVAIGTGVSWKISLRKAPKLVYD